MQLSALSLTSVSVTLEKSETGSTAQLQALLEELMQTQTMSSKLLWLEKLARWMAGSQKTIPEQFLGSNAKESHLRFFLKALNDYPTSRRFFVQLLCDCLTQTQAMALFAISGLNPDSVTEALRDHLLQRNAEKNPGREKKLGDVLLALFPNKDYASWLTGLPTELVVEILQLVYFIDNDLSPDQSNPWKIVRLDLVESMSVVSAKILATAFSGAMEVEESQFKLRSSPFLTLEHACETLHTGLKEGDRISHDALFEMSSAVMTSIATCREHIEVTANAVSRKPIVYRSSSKSQLGLVKALLDRLEGIVGLLVPTDGLISIPHVLAFVANLLESVINEKHWWNRTQYTYNVHAAATSAVQAKVEAISDEVNST
jgi:site-specific recombinase